MVKFHQEKEKLSVKKIEDLIVQRLNVAWSIKIKEEQMIQIKFNAKIIILKLFKKQEASSLVSIIIRSLNARDVKYSRESLRHNLILKVINYARDVSRINMNFWEKERSMRLRITWNELF